MSESKKTKNEKLKEEKKVIEEELTKAEEKQEQIEQQQLQKVRNWANFLIDNERRRWVLRLVIKGGIIEDVAPYLKYCTDLEFYELMDFVFSIPQVQRFITEQQRINL